MRPDANAIFSTHGDAGVATTTLHIIGTTYLVVAHDVGDPDDIL